MSNSKIKLDILSRSKLRAEINGKTIIIKGETTLTPAFYADKNSIIKWEAPFDNLKIGEDEKGEIIEKIVGENGNNSFNVFFD